MKILYVLNSSNHGGMEKHVEDLVRGMTEHNHKVYVWCLEGDIVELYKEAGAEVFTEYKIRFEIDPKYISPLVKFLKEYEIDVIHAHELKAVANSLLAGFIARTPVKVSHTHTPISEWQTNSVLEKLWWIPTSIGYAMEVNLFSDMEIALTQSRKKVKTLEGISPNKLEIIPNGLPIEMFDLPKRTRTTNKNKILKKHKIPKDSFIFGNVGRLTQEKGTEVLIRAFAEFLRYPMSDTDKFYLLLVGGGKLEDDMRNLVKELGIEKKVIITGIFEEEDKVKYYSTLDVFVFPTFAEGFGIVLMEAMLSSLPVLSSDLPVLHEVAEDTVTFFEPGNSSELAHNMESIYRAITNKEYDTEKARQLIIDKYSLDSFTKQYVNLYTKLLARKNL